MTQNLKVPKTPKEILQFVKENGIQYVDYRFVDLFGQEQHKTHPIHQLEEETFKFGSGFDGSSVRGFRAINESDMIVVPDPTTAFIDPFFSHPTLVMNCTIYAPTDLKNPYERDSRAIAQKAEAYLKSTGLADTSYWGPEAEFFVFDDVRYTNSMNKVSFEVDSEEAGWNTGKDESPNLGYKILPKKGYFPVPPNDTQQDLRSEMVALMEEVGITIEMHHHEVATAQAEIDMRFDTLTAMGDKLLKYKYIVKNVARRYGKVATFMPKPIFGDNGSGMHCHQSLWKDGKPLFAGEGYAHLSEMAIYYIGGLLKHGPAIAAFTNPSTNSYKRLVPGYEAPVNLAYSGSNRSASIRIPAYSTNPKAIRLEYRPPDATANPYLAFSAMLMAGLDGIQNKIHPGDPLTKNLYEMSDAEKKDIKSMPGSLEEAIANLRADHDFLLKGGVFTKELIDTYCDIKFNDEAKPNSMRPTPYEYQLYFDC